MGCARATKTSSASARHLLYILSKPTSPCLLSCLHYKHAPPSHSRQPATRAAAPGHSAGSCKRRRIGSTDDYELTRTLGNEGFGIVVKAHHRGTGIDVALKFVQRCSPARACGKKKRSLVVLHRDQLTETCYLAPCRGRPAVVGFHGIARGLAW